MLPNKLSNSRAIKGTAWRGLFVSLVGQNLEHVSSLRIMNWNPRPISVLMPAVRVRDRAGLTQMLLFV